METRAVSRIVYAVLLAATIVIGLLTRSSFVPAETPLGRYAGDIFWAVALYWTLTLAFPRWHPPRLAIITTLVSCVVEFSQLYQAEWINRVRSMMLGGLLLGYTFHWPDLLCYTSGAALAGVIDFQVLRRQRSSPWQWWLMSGIKEKLLCWGILGLAFSTLMLTLNLVYIKIISASCALFLIGLCIKSEDSTDI